MPLARKIGLLRLEGKSDREIAKELGISRTSMYRMLDKAKAILQEEFEEI
jgi:transposase